jgi:hypothetical protein
LAGALKVQDAAHVIITSTVFLNNASVKTQAGNDVGAASAISIHNNCTGEDKNMPKRPAT